MQQLEHQQKVLPEYFIFYLYYFSLSQKDVLTFDYFLICKYSEVLFSDHSCYYLIDRMMLEPIFIAYYKSLCHGFG